MRVIEPNVIIETPLDGQKILSFIEECGRVCYKSEDKITATSKEEFVSKLIARGHESVLEHVSCTVRFICDRGVSHELVRHRIASFSQESTRYCNYSGECCFIIPGWLTIPEGSLELVAGDWYRGSLPIRIGAEEDLWLSAMDEAEHAYAEAINRYHWTPQEARTILPNSTKTEVVMTANLREWRTVLKQRTAPGAHPQMRQLMVPLLKALQSKVPIVFDDIKY